MEATTEMLIDGYVLEFIILVLLGALVGLWRAYQAAQEKRIEEGLAARDALNQSSSTIEKLVTVVSSMRDELLRKGDG